MMKYRFRCACIVLAALLLAAAAQAQVQVVSSLITTFAGGGSGCAGQTDSLGDGCPAADSGLRNPTGIAVDSAGNLYISDDFDNVIRKVSKATGEITTVAGSGTGCAGQTDSIGDGCPATSAPLSNPQAVAVDSQGNFYITDYGNTRIRKVTAATGTITTVAGNGTTGYMGDTGQATGAELDKPFGLAVNTAGTLLYIADSGNNVVRQVNLTTGVVTTYAGNGTGAGTTGGGYTGDTGPAIGAEMWNPSGVALDTNGNLYIADTYNSAIREVNAATLKITTVAGNGSPNYTGDGGLATSATLYFPNDVTVDSAGDLFIADSYNCLIREVNAVTRLITTVAGNPQDAGEGQGTFSGDNGPPTLANLNLPDGVAIDSFGNLYIADTANYRVRKVGAPNSLLNFPATAVGASSVTQNVQLYFGAYYTEQPGLPPTEVPITISSSGIPKSVGGTQEFTIGTLSGCVADGETPINAGSICTVSVAFKPGYPGLQEAPLELQTNAGPFYFGLSGIGTAPEPALIPGLITTVAGTGGTGYTGDNGPATSATFNAVFAVALDYAGNEYIDDYNNDVFRKVTAATGVVTTFAGDGTEGYTGDNFPATGAELQIDWNAGTDSAGNVYIADTNNNVIREVNAATGIITTVVGDCCAFNGPGNQGYNGDNIPAIGAELFFPESVATDTSGNLYIADYGNNRVREVNVASGVITTVAGNGFGSGATGTGGYTGDKGPATSAELDGPSAVALDSAGNIYIADFYNDVVRKVTVATGIITTVAGDGTFGLGGDNGPATSAELASPIGIAVDAAGNLYIASNAGDVRKVDAATGIITTIAGGGTGCTGETDSIGDGCGATSVNIGVQNLALDSIGNLYIADSSNNRVREVALTTAQITFPETAAGSSSLPITFKVANVGNASLNLTAIAPTANFTVDSGTTTCSTSEAVPFGGSCVIGVVFSPTAGGASTGTLTLTDNALNVAGSTQQVALNGTIGASSGTPDFTITTFTPTMEVVQGGDSATYVLTITAEDGFGGTVALSVTGDTALGVSLPASVTIPPGGSQNFNVTLTSTLSPSGTFPFTITGSTSGGLQHSVVISLIVDKPALTPTVAVTPTSSSITTAQALMVTVTVNGGSGNPIATGYVTLTSGTYTSSAATLSGGSATINIPAGSLATSLDTLTATYSPDSAGALNYANATGSNTVTVTTPAKTTPTVTVTPSAMSITTAQALTVTVAVGGGSGNPTPSGSVTLTSGSYTSGAVTLSSGGATINIPAGSLATSTDTLTVSYTPDSNSSTTYNGATGSNTVTVITPAKITPTVTVTPSTTSITTTQALTVMVTVSGGDNPTPTGSVTLTSGSYTSTAVTLSSGGATINIPVGSLATSTDTLTVSYIPDSNSSSTYNSATGSSTVTVTAAGVQVTVGTSPAGLSFSVDGTTYSGTQTLSWTVGSSHTLATTSPQTSGGTQNTFASWSDEGAISHTVTAPSSVTTYTATFNTAYQLTTATNPASDGTVLPASGTFYAVGTVVNLSATPNSGYTFTNWTGNVASTSNASTTVTMNAAQSVTANFTAIAVPTFTVTSSTSPQTVQPGGTAQYSITVAAQNGTFSSPVTLAASGLPTGATATFSPNSITPGSASSTSTLSIQTAAAMAAVTNRSSGWPLAAPALALLGLFFVPGKRRRRWITLGVLLFASVTALTALSGCGGGFGLGSHEGGSTSYTITVTGTSGETQQTTTVQLTVQ
jgi:trimeric autotransporter adhesin